jgi:hypothetical protein
VNTKSPSPLRIRRGAIATAAAALLLGTSACGLGDSGADKTAASAPAKATSASPAGNGVADKSADEILKAAIDAFSAAKSVHVKGTVTEAGEKITLDLYLTHDGGSRGTIAAPVDGKTLRFSIISTNGKFYLKGRELWRQAGGAAAAELIGDRWVLVPKEQAKDFKDFKQLASIDSFVNEVLKTDEPLTKGEQTVVDGRPTIGLKGSDGTLHVATTETPYPLKLVPLEPKTQGEGLAFLDYNAPVNLEPPTDALDTSKLRG